MKETFTCKFCNIEYDLAHLAQKRCKLCDELYFKIKLYPNISAKIVRELEELGQINLETVGKFVTRKEVEIICKEIVNEAIKEREEQNRNEEDDEDDLVANYMKNVKGFYESQKEHFSL